MALLTNLVAVSGVPVEQKLQARSTLSSQIREAWTKLINSAMPPIDIPSVNLPLMFWDASTLMDLGPATLKDK